MAPHQTLDIPPHLDATLRVLSRFGFSAPRDIAALSAQEVDTVRSHVKALERCGYARGRHFGTPYLRTEKRWWVADRGYRAEIAAADNAAQAHVIREERAGLGAMVLRPDAAALINRVVATIVPHVEDTSELYTSYFDSGPLDLLLEFSKDRFLFFMYVDQALRRRRVWTRLKELRELFTGSMYHTVVITTTSKDRLFASNWLRNLSLPGSVGTVHHVLNPGLQPWWNWEEEKWEDSAGVSSQVGYRTYTETGKRVPVTDMQLPFIGPRTTPVRGVATAAALNVPRRAKEIVELLHLWPKTARSSLKTILGVSSSQLSDHLRPLRERGLVATERQGRVMYCLLTRDGIKQVADRGAASSRDLYNLLSPDYIKDERGRTVREGTLVRAREGEPEHHDLVMESIGLISTAIRKETVWKVAGLIPPRRGRLPFSPGDRVEDFRDALFDWIPQASRRRQLNTNTELVIFPDATIEVEDQTSARTDLLVEVELSSATEAEWRERLERYVLYSLMRPSSCLPLFVVPDNYIELTVATLQTHWVLQADTRRWPAAFTTVSRLRNRGADGNTWRVDARTSLAHPLRSLPALMQGP